MAYLIGILHRSSKIKEKQKPEKRVKKEWGIHGKQEPASR